MSIKKTQPELSLVASESNQKSELKSNIHRMSIREKSVFGEYVRSITNYSSNKNQRKFL